MKYRTRHSIVVMFAALLPALVFAQASVLSKAQRTSESMEPALSFPAQERVAQKKLDALRKKTGKKPNIVWLIADDMGYGDPGVFGGGAIVGAATPNIDRLAREGLKLTSTYSQPTCTPTRSAILTGRLPARTGLTRPHDIGFDEFYGYYEAEKEISQGVDKRRYPDLVLNPERIEMLRKTGSSDALIHGFKHDRTEEVSRVRSIEDMAEGDRVLREFSVAKISELAKQGKPFFLEHALMKVHADTFPSKAFEGKSTSKYPYRDSVVELDAYVGEIVKALADAGVLENTFIFFASDNGPQRDS